MSNRTPQIDARPADSRSYDSSPNTQYDLSSLTENGQPIEALLQNDHINGLFQKIIERSNMLARLDPESPRYDQDLAAKVNPNTDLEIKLTIVKQHDEATAAQAAEAAHQKALQVQKDLAEAALAAKVEAIVAARFEIEQAKLADEGQKALQAQLQLVSEKMETELATERNQTLRAIEQKKAAEIRAQALEAALVSETAQKQVILALKQALEQKIQEEQQAQAVRTAEEKAYQEQQQRDQIAAEAAKEAAMLARVNTQMQNISRRLDKKFEAEALQQESIKLRSNITQIRDQVRQAKRANQSNRVRYDEERKVLETVHTEALVLNKFIDAEHDALIAKSVAIAIPQAAVAPVEKLPINSYIAAHRELIARNRRAAQNVAPATDVTPVTETIAAATEVQADVIAQQAIIVAPPLAETIETSPIIPLPVLESVSLLVPENPILEEPTLETITEVALREEIITPQSDPRILDVVGITIDEPMGRRNFLRLVGSAVVYSAAALAPLPSLSGKDQAAKVIEGTSYIQKPAAALARQEALQTPKTLTSAAEQPVVKAVEANTIQAVRSPEAVVGNEHFTNAIAGLIETMRLHNGKTWPGSAAELAALFSAIAKQYNHPIVTKEFLATLAFHESRFDPRAKNSRSSATGLGQFTNATWKDYGRDLNGDGKADRFNPLENIDAMARNSIKNYEAAIKKLGNGAPSLQLTLLTAAANLGIANIHRHGLGFITSGRGQKFADEFQKVFSKFTPPPAPQPEVQPPAPRRTGEQIVVESKQKHGEKSGRLNPEDLRPLRQEGHSLARDAAEAFTEMDNTFHSRFGRFIGVTDSYRSYDNQVKTKAKRGNMAATPGQSMHGWGVAVDLGEGINNFGSPEHEWMRANAAKYGWIHPGWAQSNGSKPEPWHWEYVGL